MPSVTDSARPSGQTSTSLAVKSVLAAEVAACRVTLTGPVTSRSEASDSLVKDSTSGRASTPRWSRGPGSQLTPPAPPVSSVAPPTVGTGSRGSWTYREGGSDSPGADGASDPLEC